MSNHRSGNPYAALALSDEASRELLERCRVTEDQPNDAESKLQIESFVDELKLMKRDEVIVKSLMKLREFANELLDKFNLRLQKDEFNFWLFDRLTTQADGSALPRALFPYVSHSLIWKLESLFPIRLSFTQELPKFIETFRIYVNRMKATFPERTAQFELEYQTTLKEGVGYAKRVVAAHRELVSDHFGSSFTQITIDLLTLSDRFAQIADAADREEPYEMLKEDLTPLSYKVGSHKITKEAYTRLSERFKGEKKFLNWHIQRLLNYYSALTSGEYGLQGSLPTSTFEYLRQIGVTTECFGSSLNSFFGRFFSVFPEVDEAFGAIGNFFTNTFTSGFYEANPPFTYEVIEPMMRKILASLSASSEPLSFVIFLPPWRSCANLAYVMRAGTVIDKGVYKTGEFDLAASAHRYLSGSQHLDRVEYMANHPTYCCILQNDAGLRKWPITPEVVENLKMTF